MTEKKTIEEMLGDLCAANRDRYEQRSGEAIQNGARFDESFRTLKLRDEEDQPGSIERAWRNLNGTNPRRGAHTSSGPSATRYELALSYAVDQLSSSAGWTPQAVEAFLVDDEDIAPLVARRAVAAALPIAEQHRATDARRRAAFHAEQAAKGVTPPAARPDPPPIRELRSVDLPAYALADQPPADDAFTTFHADEADADPDPSYTG